MANRSALSRATESTDAPTPGYLYIDIAKSAASSPAATRDTLQYLIRRLQNSKNHNVKFKCLKVLQKTAESNFTRGQFKREICLDNDATKAIKACVQFLGIPDPVRGDEIYMRVRTAAKDCLDTIYSDTPSSEGMFGSSSNAGLVGASSSMGMGGGKSMGGGNSMEGIGNPMFSDPRLGEEKTIKNMTVSEVASTFGETIVGMIKDPLAKNVVNAPPPVSGMPGYGPTSIPPGSRNLALATGGQWTMASNRGPNAINREMNYNKERDGDYYRAKTNNAFKWAQSDTSKTTSTSSGVGGNWATSVSSQSRAAAHSLSSMPPGSSGTALEDGSYERNLIQELCAPGGLKPEPPPDKLKSFQNAIQSLNSDLICPALLDCLEDGQPWVMKAKALCVMEACISLTYFKESNPYADFFHACKAEIEPLGIHPRQAIREPANRVLQILGIDASSAPPPKQPVQQKPQPVQPVADLLDFGSEEPPPPPPSEAPPVAPSNNIFANLSTPSEAPPVAPSTNIFANLSIKEDSSKNEAASGFSFMNENPPIASPLLETSDNAIPPSTNISPPIETSSKLLDSVAVVASSPPTKTPFDHSSTLLDPVPAVASPKLMTNSFDPPSVLLEPLPKLTSVASPKVMTKSVDPSSTLLEPVTKPTSDSFDPLLNPHISSSTKQQPMMNLHQTYIPYPIYMNPQMVSSFPMKQMHTMPQQPQHYKTNIMVGAPVNIMGSAQRQVPVSFMDNEVNKKKEQQIKSFDFIKDTMKNAK